MNIHSAFLSGLMMTSLLFIGACKPNQGAQNTKPYVDISIADAMVIHATKSDVIFLDVRTPEETAEGTIPNAEILDIQAEGFEDKLTELDPEKSYIVYCRSGGRSARASKIMEQQGFKDVKNMVGGYNGWKELNK